MIAYLDASVLLRFVLAQPDRLAEWSRITRAVSSDLVRVECLRTIDRLQQMAKLDAGQVPELRAAIYELLESVETVAIGQAVLERAAQPFSSPLGTLDALHLASALLWREAVSRDLVLATHDRALARAARASGLATIGI